MTDLWSEFLKCVREHPGRHVWDGVISPNNFAFVDLRTCNAFRPTAVHNGKYNVVWSIEKAIDQQGWKLHVDSLLRLLQQNGILVLRCVENFFISLPALKSFLFRKLGYQISQIFEEYEGSQWTLVFEVRRTNLVAQTDKTWTYSILTQGDKVEHVKAFCRSVREIDQYSQIIIVGPHNHEYVEFNAFVLDRNWGPYSTIAKKKNEVIEFATGENILFCHDRYVLNRDFLDGFEQFGYDFEYATPKQFHSSGKIYPALCAITDLQALILGHVYSIQNDKEVWQSGYLNGGLFVAKKNIIRDCPMNPMLYHRQAEDVEFAAQLFHRSILPRLNYHSSAVTDAPDKTTEPFSDGFYSDFHDKIAQYYSKPHRKRGIDTIIERLHRARFEDGANLKTLLRVFFREIYRAL